MYLQSCLLFALLVFRIEAKNEDYKGFKVYNIKFRTQQQQDNFHVLKSDIVDYWRKPSLKHGVTGQAMVPPSHFDWFEEKLLQLDIERDVFVEDVFEYLNKVEKDLTKTVRNDTDRVFGFDGYYRYQEILNHMNALQEAYVNSSTSITVVEFGQTELNRPIVYLKISKNTEANDTEVEKPVVIIEAGINPREWITIPSALNIVNRLLENNTQFLDRSDWIIVPVVNPDGYEYTHTNLRLWMKNRSTRSNLGFICPGVNINRNFDISWLISDSSSSPCSHLYGGLDPFSEIESQLIKNILEEYGTRIRLYVSIQNNGGFVSYPWQFERAASGMFRQHHLLGLEIVKAMREEYTLDVGWSALGDRASGTSSDFAQDSGVVYSLNVDVVQKGDGVNIPEEDILDVIEDVWRAVAVAAEKLL